MFGKKISYVYGNVYKNMLFCGHKTFKISEEDRNTLDKLKYDGMEVMGTINEDKILKVFDTEATVFNSHILSEENDKLQWYNSDTTSNKVVFSKKYEKCKNSKWYVCKKVKEDDTTIEIEVVKYEEKQIAPGIYFKGKFSAKKDENFVKTQVGEGKVILQTNEYYAKNEEITVILIEIDHDNLVFAECYNPIKTCTMPIVNTVNGLHFLKNGNIQGVCLESETTKGLSEIEVKVKQVRFGSYVFEESPVLFDKAQYFKILRHFKGKHDSHAIVKCLKTKTELKAKFIGKTDNKNFRGKIIDYNAKDDIYIIDTNIIEDKKEEKVVLDNTEKIEEVKSNWDNNPLPIFAKYEDILSKDAKFLALYLKYLHEKNMFELEDVKKYVNRFLRKETPLQIISEVENKELLNYIFTKSKSKKVFEQLIKILTPEEIEKHCTNHIFRSFYFVEQINNNKYEEANKVLAAENDKNTFLRKIRSKEKRKAFEEFIKTN